MHRSHSPNATENIWGFTTEDTQPQNHGQRNASPALTLHPSLSSGHQAFP